jgi:hypothetical protein
MGHFARQPAMQAITFAPPNQPPPDGSRFLIDSSQDSDRTDSNIAFMKGPKRKRLAKVCTPQATRSGRVPSILLYVGVRCLSQKQTAL